QRLLAGCRTPLSAAGRRSPGSRRSHDHAALCQVALSFTLTRKATKESNRTANRRYRRWLIFAVLGCITAAVRSQHKLHLDLPEADGVAQRFEGRQGRVVIRDVERVGTRMRKGAVQRGKQAHRGAGSSFGRGGEIDQADRGVV